MSGPPAAYPVSILTFGGVPITHLMMSAAAPAASATSAASAASAASTAPAATASHSHIRCAFGGGPISSYGVGWSDAGSQPVGLCQDCTRIYQQYHIPDTDLLAHVGCFFDGTDGCQKTNHAHTGVCPAHYGPIDSTREKFFRIVKLAIVDNYMRAQKIIRAQQIAQQVAEQKRKEQAMMAHAQEHNPELFIHAPPTELLSLGSRGATPLFGSGHGAAAIADSAPPTRPATAAAAATASSTTPKE